jgi:hypothetical protein
MLILDPSGGLLQLPTAYLSHTPFKTYLVPGIILFIANGLLSIIIAIFTIIRHKHYPLLIIFQASVLTGWLTIELIMIKVFYPPMHILCYSEAFILFTGGLYLLKFSNKIKSNKHLECGCNQAN